MATVLNADEVKTALASLAGWSYDGQALVRRIEVPAESHPGLLESVGNVADELDHHPVIGHDGDVLLFRLWTHSAGGVTTKDVELAARMDQILSGSARDSGTA